MAINKASGYQSRPVEYSREPEPREMQRQPEPRAAERKPEAREAQRAAVDPAKPTPDQARTKSIAKNQRQAQKPLGGRIDVYA